MIDFSDAINLPLIWGAIIATAVFLYVLLDGFDLGIGIIFPFAPSQKCRDRMMNSIAPFWDGNETWLVLGGAGLFVAFPLAYAVLLPAFYIPIIIMLSGLILRGVAFEFRFKATEKLKPLWDYVFHVGSFLAAFCQGLIIGAFVQGVEVQGRNFSGHPLDWASAFSLLTGVAVVFGYILLGSTWLIMKTEDTTQQWARHVAAYSLACVGILMALVSLSTAFLNEAIKTFWFSLPHFYYLLPIPCLTAIAFIVIWYDLYHGKQEYRPFIGSTVIFILGYIGIAISIYPWIVPFKFTFTQAAASGPSLSLMLIGTAFLLPLILMYTTYCYYIFRGKSSHEIDY